MASGIRILVDPATDGADSLVDIVAIHGIGAHPDDTWSGRGPDGKRIYWLSDSDMLPQSVPYSRIMRFGYESNWNDANKINKRTYVSDVADILLRDLESHRRDVTRPIIFLAHSYGGLVLIHALRRSFDDRSRWANIFGYTAGIVFFGTPFRGRKGLSFAAVVEAIAYGDPNQEIPGHQNYPETMSLADEENPYLQDIVYRFTETRRGSNPIPLRFFYETKPSQITKLFPPGSSINDGYLVVVESACLDISKNIERYPLERHHYNLQKFSGRSDPQYRVVEDSIIGLVNGASEFLGHSAFDKCHTLIPLGYEAILGRLLPEILKSNKEQQQKELRARILSTIRFPQMNARENQIQSVSEATTRWIFDQRDSDLETEGTHIQFTQWLEAEDPVFWISGKPGSGKSSLMKFLVSDIRTREHLNKWRPDVTICRYFFIETGQHPLQREYRGCLRALLYQLLDSKPHVFDPLLQKQPNLAAKYSENDWSVEELHDVFLVALGLTNSPTCLFLDGLDEIAFRSGDRDSIIGLIKELSQYGKVKACVSSRPENIFHIRLGSYPCLKTQHLNGPAIDLYIESRLAQYKPSSPTELREYHKLIEALSQKASGVFLWVYLVTNSIVDGIEGEDSWHTLYQRTAELEPDIYLLFQQMLERQNANTRFYKEDTARLLWYSLHINEMTLFFESMSTVIAYIFATHAEFRSDLLRSVVATERITQETRVAEKYRKWLSARGAGLLEVNKRISKRTDTLLDYEVRFIHRSVQEFLLGTTAGNDILLVDRSSSKERLLRTAKAMKDIAAYYLTDDSELCTVLFGGYMNLLFELVSVGYLTPKEELEEILACKNWLQSRAPEVFSDFDFFGAIAQMHNAKFLSQVPEALEKLSCTEKSILLSIAFHDDSHDVIGPRITFDPLIALDRRVTGSQELRGDWAEQYVGRLIDTISLLLRAGADLNTKLSTDDLGCLKMSRTPFHDFLYFIIDHLFTPLYNNYQRVFFNTQGLKQLYPALAVCCQEFKQYRIDWELSLYFYLSSDRNGKLTFRGLDRQARSFDTRHSDKYKCVFGISSRWLQDFLGRVDPLIAPDQKRTEIMKELDSVEYKVQCAAVKCTEVAEARDFKPPNPNKIKEKRQFEDIIRRGFLGCLYDLPDMYEDISGSLLSGYIKLLSEYTYHIA